MTDKELLQQFEDASLPAAGFHHAEHVRVAFLYLRDYPVLEAMARFVAALRRFAAVQGKEGLYHETITWAYLLLIHERMQRQDSGGNWDAFYATNRDLFDWKPSVLELYYAPETLRSEFSRRVFVLPDLGASAPTSRGELQAESLRQGKQGSEVE